MGTTRMDADPRKGVVDANLQVHGVSNCSWREARLSDLQRG